MKDANFAPENQAACVLKPGAMTGRRGSLGTGGRKPVLAGHIHHVRASFKHIGRQRRPGFLDAGAQAGDQ
jgi:hypothetical protein